MSFFSFTLAALYGEINPVSFLFPAAVALYHRIFKASLDTLIVFNFRFLSMNKL